ncbi:MAG TPA: FtsH protease activity modulator HflK [Rhodanobacteraceae bacterium]
MPWKEPGEKPREPRGREPWGPGQGGHGNGPDLDAWLRKVQRWLGPFGRGPFGAFALLALIIILWFVIGGWVVVGPNQAGVVARFGRVVRVLEPGMHLRLPSPIARVQLVSMGQARNVGDTARLLTRDGAVVLLDYSVQYKVTDARAFMLTARNPEDVLRDTATSAARAVVGTHTLACLVASLELPCSDARDTAQLAAAMQAQIVAALASDGAKLGFAITQVGVQGVEVPTEAKPAFDAITKAHADAKAAQATAAADVVRGQAKLKEQVTAIQTAAAAYQRATVADAHAGVAQFGQLVAAYKAAPDVTRHQLWLGAMQAVLSKNHVVVNTGSGNVVVQFPARHAESAAAPASAASSAPASGSATPASAASTSIPVTSGPSVAAVSP